MRTTRTLKANSTPPVHAGEGNHATDARFRSPRYTTALVRCQIHCVCMAGSRVRVCQHAVPSLSRTSSHRTNAPVTFLCRTKGNMTASLKQPQVGPSPTYCLMRCNIPRRYFEVHLRRGAPDTTSGRNIASYSSPNGNGDSVITFSQEYLQQTAKASQDQMFPFEDFANTCWYADTSQSQFTLCLRLASQCP